MQAWKYFAFAWVKHGGWKDTSGKNLVCTKRLVYQVFFPKKNIYTNICIYIYISTLKSQKCQLRSKDRHIVLEADRPLRQIGFPQNTSQERRNQPSNTHKTYQKKRGVDQCRILYEIHPSRFAPNCHIRFMCIETD